MKPKQLLLGILIGAGPVVTPAIGQPYQYQIVSKTVSLFSTGGPYSLVGTFGQPAPLILSGGAYTLSEGFFGVAVAIQQPGAPPLKITQVNQTIVISWPAPSVGFELEVKNSLDPDVSWNPAGLPVIVVGGSENTVTVPLAPGPRFFRLHSP
jgi:hypothetical protein